MGLAAGGRMRQHIYPDPHGVDTWDADNFGRVFVHIVNSQMWREITGEDVPPTPSTRAPTPTRACRGSSSTTTTSGTSQPSDVLANVKSVADKDAQHGFTGPAGRRPDRDAERQAARRLVPDGKW